MAETTIQDLLMAHPWVRRCALIETPTKAGDRLLAYVETDTATAAQLKMYLTGAGIPAASLPDAVIVMPALPVHPHGGVDVAALPLPPVRSKPAGKSGLRATGSPERNTAVVVGIAATVLSLPFTGVFWPGSTDLTMVPLPWANLFRGLYLAESLSFGIGMAVLFTGRPALARFGRSRMPTGAAHLALVWLMVAWWPQDNFYRLAVKTDWPRQAALVYGFNITLMIAAVVLAVFLLSARRDD